MYRNVNAYMMMIKTIKIIRTIQNGTRIRFFQGPGCCAMVGCGAGWVLVLNVYIVEAQCKSTLLLQCFHLKIDVWLGCGSQGKTPRKHGWVNRETRVGTLYMALCILISCRVGR